MKYDLYPHPFADIILNADYALRQEIEDTVKGLSFAEVLEEFTSSTQRRTDSGKRGPQGKQSAVNYLFRREFMARGWQIEKRVFDDPENDLSIDFWKRHVGVDVAFNHRSFIGGDLLRLQAAAEVKNVIKVGVYICPTKEFLSAPSAQADELPARRCGSGMRRGRHGSQADLEK